MGELRNSIIELGKQVAGAAKMGESVGAELEALNTRVGSLIERVYAGHDVLWLYLESKFEKDGRKLANFKNDKVADHADSEVVTYIKGINSAADDTVKAINDFTAAKSKVSAEYQKIDAAAAAIRRNLDKKRAKLFQSKAYKTKLATYEKALDELLQAVATRRAAFDKIAVARSVKTVDGLRLKPTNKIDDVRHISVKAEIDNVKKAEQHNVVAVRQIRQNGDLRKALETMKQWANDADSMDQEVLNLDPDAVKPIKDVHIFQGRTLLGTAPKAIFQGKRPMEVPSFTWARGISSLDYLQKNVRIEAKYEKGDGTFSHDMKINGIKGATIKLS